MKIKFIKEYRAVGCNTKYQAFYSAGRIVDFSDSSDSAQWLIDNGFAEEVKESGWWKPKNGEGYYFTDDSGCIKQDTWRNSFWQVDRYRTGNVFKTEEAVKRYWDYLKAIATVRQDEGVLTPEQAAKNGYIYYICIHGEFGLVVHGFNADYVSANTVLFDTREHAQASRDKHPDEWKIIVNYDWSRE